MKSYLFNTADDIRTSMHGNRNRDFIFSVLFILLAESVNFAEPLIGTLFASEAL